MACAGAEGEDDAPEFGALAQGNHVCSRDVLTQGYGPERLNAQTCESTLTPANVNQNVFGKLYSRYVDGRVYAQPLYVEGVTVGGVAKNAVFVATANNKVYAFDADSTSTDPHYGARLWAEPTALGGGKAAQVEHIVEYVVDDDSHFCRGVSYPFSGIIGTPAIDKANNVMFVVAEEEPVGPPTPTIQHVLYKINLSTGAIVASQVIATPPGGVGGAPFYSPYQIQRAGLLLQGGSVYIAFAGNCGDPVDPDLVNKQYKGWVFKYAASTLAYQAAFRSDLLLDGGVGGGAGIWQSGSGLVGKTATGDVYLMSGNGMNKVLGDYSVPYGDAFLKFSGGSLASAARYQQPNDVVLAAEDLDLGSGGPMLLPSGRLVGGGKLGKLYSFNTTAPSTDVGGATAPLTVQATHCAAEVVPGGGVCNDNCEASGTCGENVPPHIHARAYFNSKVYVWGERDYLRALSSVTLAQLAGSAGVGNLPSNGDQDAPNEPTSPTTTVANGMYDWRVPTMVALSGDDTANGIVWAVKSRGGHESNQPYAPPARLYAINAANLTQVLWHSDQRPRDALPSHPRFAIPTVANGKVWQATFSDEVTVYGPTTPVVTGFSKDSHVAAVSRTTGKLDTYVIGNDGEVYTQRYDSSSGGWVGTGLSKIALPPLYSGGPQVVAPPGAPIAAIAPDATHIDLFFVDNLGRLITIWWDTASGYHIRAMNDSQWALGGRGTAAPGSPVGAISFKDASGNQKSIHVSVITSYGRELGFKWTAAGGWAAPVKDAKLKQDPLNGNNVPAGVMLRTPLTMLSYATDAIQLFFTGRDNRVWQTWTVNDGATWTPAVFDSLQAVSDRAPIGGFSRGPTSEDMFVADKAGRVWRGYWDGTGWNHSSYTPLGWFSSNAMLGTRSWVSATARDGSNGNLFAIGPAGQVYSQWFSCCTNWQHPSPFAMTLSSSTTWQSFLANGTAQPGTPIATVQNGPAAGHVDMFWADAAGHIWRKHYGTSWDAAVRMDP